ncbi:MAG TPA: FKBP-type peptidyl-prolyl cis-trans isomerase [Acidobacteriaceae bacterium]
MKLALLLLASAAAPLAAQTTHPAAKPAVAVHHVPAAGNAACAKLPDLSPKIPALPAGAPCAKPLYTISTVPNIKLDYVSPFEGPALQKTLGIEPSSFSLDYIDVKVGTGEIAAPHKWYTIHYTGYLTDGTKFDSSYDHPGQEPFVFQYGSHQVVAGWDTGFAGMHVGGKRRLFIPFQLAYGPNGRPPTIPAMAELVFDLEFISQSDQQPAPKAPPTPPAASTPQPAPDKKADPSTPPVTIKQ